MSALEQALADYLQLRHSLGHELADAGLTPDNFASENDRRQRYLERFAGDTADLFSKAAAALPAQDRRALRAARIIMATTYERLLRKMRRDALRVTETRYRLSAPEKLAAIAAGIFAR